jgi:hydrogenase maturation protease
VTRHVVIGVGNDYRGDDGAALAVVRRLESEVPADVTVRAFEQEPTRLIDAWDGAESAVVVDAVASGAEPGTFHRFDASAEPIPARVFRSSTHAFGVGEAIELARALGKLPGRVVVYGIEGASFAAGEGLSPAVAEAVEPAAAAVLEELARLAREEEPCTSGR